MSAFLLRAALSGLIIAAIAMIGRKAPGVAAIITAIPLLSVMGMIWLWHDTGDRALLAGYSQATFFYVIPTLPMFILIAYMLRHGWNFWVTLLGGIVLTVALFFATIAIASRLGYRI